jgi:signal transduction histidine kinase
MVCISGFVATVLSMFGHFIEHSIALIWPIKIAMLICIIVMLYLTNYHGMYQVCKWLAVIGFCDLVFPVVFVLNGGFEGGTSTYFVLSFVVIVLLLKGSARLLLSAVTMLVIAACYFVNIAMPDLVVHLNYEQRFIDSLLTFIITAAFIAIVVIIQNKMSLLERSRMEVAARAKGDFLAQMSHEMRTPLNAILGMAGIASRAQDEETSRASIEKIEGASKHLLGVINDILDMSKIETGSLELHDSSFDFYDMLATVLTLSGYDIAKKSQYFNRQIDSQIPRYLHGDGQRLAQVLINLLANACKFTEEGGSITLTINARELEGNSISLAVSVEDTGIGISEEQLARLFQPFEQADNSSSRVYGGMGLGLAISRRIIAEMGGNLEVASVLGQGSCFSFTVVLAKTATGEDAGDDDYNQDEPGTAADEPQNVNLNDKLAAHTILLAEDIDINSEIAIALLEPTAARIELARNGREAVEKFAANPSRYSLILMDIQMPEMDGYEATREIRALSNSAAKSVPILAMTANVLADDISKSMESGMNDHIAKPIDANQLYAKIAKYLHCK